MVGKIAVLGEHLNFAMFQCCCQLLEVRGLPQNYAQTVFCAGDAEAIGMIDLLSNRLDKLIRRRNDSVHRLWFIGWGDEETKSYEAAASIKAVRDIRKKSVGGVKYTNEDTKDFEEIVDELRKLTSLVMRFLGCVAMIVFHPDESVGKPVANFHYDTEGQVVTAPLRQGHKMAPKRGGAITHG